MVTRGLKLDTKLLFVVDGAKALRMVINKMFGPQRAVERCRNHKIGNVAERPPGEEKNQVKAAMRPAYRLEPKEGIALLRKLADWLEQEQPTDAASLREGLEESFTLNPRVYRLRPTAAWPRPI